MRFPHFTRRALLLIAFCILFSPRAAACGLCVASQISYRFPFFPAAIIILGIWRVAALHLELRHHLIKQPNTFFVLRLVLLFFLAFFAAQAAFFVYLAGAFCIACFRLLRHRTELRRPSIYRTLGILNLAALLLLAPFIALGYHHRNSLSPLDQLRTYIYPGTGPSRVFIRAHAADPSFSLANLTQMLNSPARDDRELACEALVARNQIGDLVALRPTFFALPYFAAGLNGDYTTGAPAWLSLWLGQIGVPSDVKTTTALALWIDSRTTAPPAR